MVSGIKENLEVEVEWGKKFREEVVHAPGARRWLPHLTCSL